MILWHVLWWVLLLYLIALVIRSVVSWVEMARRSWRPRGIVLVVVEGVYTITDPPLRAMGKVIPPLRLGAMALDTAFMVLFFICLVLLNIVGALR